MDADSTQKPISVILDEIEEENALTRQGYPTLSACLDQHLQSELALVKALRRAMDELEVCRQSLDRNPANYNPRGLELKTAHKRVTKAIPDITTILNQGRSVGDNKGSDQL